MIGALLLLLAATAAQSPGAAQHGEARALMPLFHRHFTVTDGLPDTSAQALVQSHDGFLWVAAEGIARFNGSTFRVLTEATTPGLPEADLHAVVEDRDHALWFGGQETEGRRSSLIERLQHGVLTRFGQDEGVPGTEVRTLHLGPTGTLWAGTDKGAASLRNGRFEPLEQSALDTWALLEDPRGELLLGTKSGLWSFRAGLAQRVLLRTDGGPEPVVKALLRARDGALWVGTSEGLFRLGGAGPLHLEQGDGLPGPTVTALCEDHLGRLWVGTIGGLALVDPVGSAVRSVPEVASTVLQILQDRERNLWVATDGDALYQLRETAVWTHELRTAGLPGDAVYSVTLARGGGVWAGTPEGLARFRDGKMEAWLTVGGHRGVLAGPVVEAADGRVWVGTLDGIARLEAGRLRLVAETDGLPAGQVRGLLEDGRGNLWIGTDKGLHRWREGKATTFTLGKGGVPGWPRVIAEDKAGRIWAGTLDGLYSIGGDDKVTRFGREDGLAAEQIYTMLVDGDDLWIGTGRAGLHLLRDGKIHPVPARARIPARGVLGLALDRAGDLWLASTFGLFRGSRRSLVAAALGEPGEVALRHFDASDGLLSLDFNCHGQASAVADAEGRLWFANAVGLVEVDPARMWGNSSAPPVQIERLVVDGKQRDLSGGLVFPVGSGAVEISYDAPLLRVADRARFRFRLGGPKAPWVDAGTRRVASFQALAAGSHVFEVSASNEEGVSSEVGSSLAFTLEPPLWRSPAFFLLAGLALAGAVAGAFRWRSTQARRREALLQGLVDERTSQLARANQDLAKNLEDLQRAQQHLVASDRRTSLGLLAAGVAHEINNPLAYITNNLSFVRDALPDLLQGKARPSLPADLSEALGEALQGALRVKKIVGGLKTLARGDQGNPRGLVDLPALLETALDVAASEVKRHAELARELGPAPRVRAHEVEVIQLLLNLVVNGAQAIDQAVAEKKPGPHKVMVRTRTGSKGEAVIEVSDTGSGMTPEVRERLFTPFFTTKPVGTGTGLGLSICQGIVTSLGGTIAVESAPGAGARFTVSLPAAGA